MVGTLPDLPGRFAGMTEENFAEIGGGTEAQRVADLLHRPVGGGQQKYRFFDADLLNQLVGRATGFPLKNVIKSRFADVAMPGNVTDLAIGVQADVISSFVFL